VGGATPTVRELYFSSPTPLTPPSYTAKGAAAKANIAATTSVHVAAATVQKRNLGAGAGNKPLHSLSTMASHAFTAPRPLSVPPAVISANAVNAAAPGAYSHGHGPSAASFNYLPTKRDSSTNTMDANDHVSYGAGHNQDDYDDENNVEELETHSAAPNQQATQLGRTSAAAAASFGSRTAPSPAASTVAMPTLPTANLVSGGSFDSVTGTVQPHPAHGHSHSDGPSSDSDTDSNRGATAKNDLRGVMTLSSDSATVSNGDGDAVSALMRARALLHRPLVSTTLPTDSDSDARPQLQSKAVFRSGRKSMRARGVHHSSSDEDSNDDAGIRSRTVALPANNIKTLTRATYSDFSDKDDDGDGDGAAAATTSVLTVIAPHVLSAPALAPYPPSTVVVSLPAPVTLVSARALLTVVSAITLTSKVKSLSRGLAHWRAVTQTRTTAQAKASTAAAARSSAVTALTRALSAAAARRTRCSAVTALGHWRQLTHSVRAIATAAALLQRARRARALATALRRWRAHAASAVTERVRAEAAARDTAALAAVRDAHATGLARAREAALRVTGFRLWRAAAAAQRTRRDVLAVARTATLARILDKSRAKQLLTGLARWREHIRAKAAVAAVASERERSAQQQQRARDTGVAALIRAVSIVVRRCETRQAHRALLQWRSLSALAGASAETAEASEVAAQQRQAAGARALAATLARSVARRQQRTLLRWQALSREVAGAQVVAAATDALRKERAAAAIAVIATNATLKAERAAVANALRRWRHNARGAETRARDDAIADVCARGRARAAAARLLGRWRAQTAVVRAARAGAAAGAASCAAGAAVAAARARARLAITMATWRANARAVRAERRMAQAENDCEQMERANVALTEAHGVMRAAHAQMKQAVTESQAAFDECQVAKQGAEAELARMRAQLDDTQFALEESHAAFAESQAVLDQSHVEQENIHVALEQSQAALTQCQASLAETKEALYDNEAALVQTEAAAQAAAEAAVQAAAEAAAEAAEAAAQREAQWSEVIAEWRESQAALRESHAAA